MEKDSFYYQTEARKAIIISYLNGITLGIVFIGILAMVFFGKNLSTEYLGHFMDFFIVVIFIYGCIWSFLINLKYRHIYGDYAEKVSALAIYIKLCDEIKEKNRKEKLAKKKEKALKKVEAMPVE